MSALALCGGEPLLQRDLRRYNTIGAEEKAAVMEVLDSGILSAFHASPAGCFLGGPRVRALEDAWCEHFGTRHAIAMNSATSALYAAVQACGIGPGDEVITSPLSMSATPSAAIVAGATPGFADVDPGTMNLDPVAVAAQITPRTRAIFAVHLAGQPCDMRALERLANEHDLRLLEDNAQAPGATEHGRLAGCIGDIGVFSLNCHKTIQCGEGGVAVTNDDDLARRLRLLRNHAEVALEAFGYSGRDGFVGYNFRMTEMEAAVARIQLDKLDDLNRERVRLADHFTRGLSSFEGIEPPVLTPGVTHVYYVYHMSYDAQRVGIPLDLFAEAVRSEGVPIVARWGRPLYQLSIYREGRVGGGRVYPAGLCPQAEAQEARSLCLTEVVRGPNTERDLDRVLEVFHKVRDGRESLLAWNAERAA